LAQDLSFAKPRRDRSEADMKSKMWKVIEYEKALLGGSIRDDMTMACVCKTLLAAGAKP